MINRADLSRRFLKNRILRSLVNVFFAFLCALACPDAFYRGRAWRLYFNRPEGRVRGKQKPQRTAKRGFEMSSIQVRMSEVDSNRTEDISDAPP